jgi:hypothetical protein
MPRVQIFRHVLFLLGRHSGGIRLTRDTPGTKQSSRHIVFGQTRLSIVELTIAAMTWFHVWSPASGLFKGAVPAGRTRRSADLVSNAAPAFSLLRHRDGRRQARHASERSFTLSAPVASMARALASVQVSAPPYVSLRASFPPLPACSPERQGSSLPRAPPSQPSSRGRGPHAFLRPEVCSPGQERASADTCMSQPQFGPMACTHELYLARNLMAARVPSQNGLLLDSPQRHRVTRSRTSYSSPSAARHHVGTVPRDRHTHLAIRFSQ